MPKKERYWDNRKTAQGIYTMKYWHDAFPAVYESALSKGDMELIGYDETKRCARSCFVRIEHTGKRSKARSSAQKLLRHPIEGDQWAFNEANFIGRVWKSTKPDGDPVGFILFDVEPITSTRSRRMSRVVLGLELAYVNRGDRGRGYGRYLALSVIHWLGACRVNGDRCVSKGVEVLLHSDFYSEGGAAIFYLIKSQLDFYHEFRGEQRTLPWKIKEVFEDAGF